MSVMSEYASAVLLTLTSSRKLIDKKNYKMSAEIVLTLPFYYYVCINVYCN